MRRVFRLPDRADRVSADVRHELELHLDLRAREFEAQGMSPDEARRAALAAFGDRAAIAEQVRAIRGSTVRERRRRDRLSGLRQDLTVGLRALRRSPGFTFVALLTLAIGIGANTAIFSVLRSVVLRPLPYHDPGELVQVWSDHRALGRATPEWLTPPDFADWRDQNRTFAGMAAYTRWAPDLTGDGDPETLTGLVVSGNFFELLGARITLGRGLTMQDDDPGVETVVVLSDAIWRRRFGADSSIIGQRITLSGLPATVVGVLDPGFRAPIQTAAPDVYRATRRPANSGCGRGCIVLRVIGRLRPGVSVAAAQADLSQIAERIAREHPTTNTSVGAWLIPLHEQLTGSVRLPLLALSGAVAIVLLIGCVNLANLLLVRAAAREREIAVRAALGAQRGRIVRQLLTESALLAGLGGALGLWLGVAGSRILGTLVPESVRQVQEIRVDSVVLLFAAGTTLLAGMAFGLLPALRAVRSDLIRSLRDGRAGTGRHLSLGSGLAVAQLTLAVVLLVGAGLLLRSFLAMQRVDLGYRSEGVSFTTVAFPPARYPEPARFKLAAQDLLERLRANPAVRTVEATDLSPLSAGDQDVTAIPVGTRLPPDGERSVWYRSVTHGYLPLMRMRLVAGRSFEAADREGAPPVGIVNEEAARRFWPGESAVGRTLAIGGSDDAPHVTIVGVVASARHDGPDQPYKPELFVPYDQYPTRFLTLVVEPAADRRALAAAYRQALREVDPLVAAASLDPIESRLGDAVALPRLYATLVGLFASAALLLAALGVYGVIAYAVAQRAREIGVRLALGADPAGIRRLVLGHGARLAVIGLGLGLAAALALGRVIETLLFAVTPFDAATLLTVPLVLAVVALVASWVPARRASRLDPASAMRTE
ncbi:MAG TPA: ABC transporter permease [Gemmatimonadaceae bacterium]|nr:ABC transporter permease [Gemmatimonadaceae bacterium]